MRLQRLSGSQSELLHSLQMLWIISVDTVFGLIDELVRDRFHYGERYLKFAQQLNQDNPLSQPHIISRGYYAMYHMARAVVFHHQRVDVDGHDRLPAALSRIAGDEMGIRLGRWRDVRNAIEYSPYTPDNMCDLGVQCLQEAEGLREGCRQYLLGRRMQV